MLSAKEAAAAGLSTADAGLGFQHPNAAGLVGRGAGYDHMGRPSLWDYANIPSVYKGKSQLLHPSMQVPLRPVTHYERVTLPNGLHMNVPHDLSQPQFGGGISAYPGQPFHPALSQGGYLPHPLSAVANPEGPGVDHRSQMYWRAQERVHTEQARAQHAMDEATQDVKVKQGRLDDFKMQSDEIQAEMEHAVQGIHKERQYIADMSRRVAALDVDKHRLDLRSKLDGLMGQYNRAEEHSNELQDARTKAGAVKRDLQGEIHATRENLRSSMSTISKLINDKGPDAEAKEDERKAEKARRWPMICPSRRATCKPRPTRPPWLRAGSSPPTLRRERSEMTSKLSGGAARAARRYPGRGRGRGRGPAVVQGRERGRGEGWLQS